MAAQSQPPLPSSFGADRSRRAWMQTAGLALAHAMGASALLPLQALAQPVDPDGAEAGTEGGSSRYRAIVCLFLFGGNDGTNMLVPMDERYATYAKVREALALPRESLHPLVGTPFGWHPSMAPLGQLWKEGVLAPLFNVGPLERPTSKEAFLAAKPTDSLVPSGLFSHSDQQALWSAGGTDSTVRTGWGGRSAQAMQLANPVIMLGGDGVFGISSDGPPLSLPAEPGSRFGLLGFEPGTVNERERRTALEVLYRAPRPSMLRNAYTKIERDAEAVSRRLQSTVTPKRGESAAYAAIDTAFEPYFKRPDPDLELGNQLYMIARLVLDRSKVRGHQQIFMASQGGYDHHRHQFESHILNGKHATMLEDLALAVSCFYRAMQALGMADAVTLFTQSDFGRTFKPNKSQGTDHAWGNHQFVVGGAVKGGRLYGTYPRLVLRGPDDVGVKPWEDQGRWIPTTSVEQYAATLLRWLGASETQMGLALPGLRNFELRDLGFLA